MTDILGTPPLTAPSYEALANLRRIEREAKVAEFLELRKWLRRSLETEGERIDFRKLGTLVLIMADSLTGDLK